MTAREGDMMGTKYGGKLVGTSCFTIPIGYKKTDTGSMTLPTVSNIDYIIINQIGRECALSDSVSNVVNSIICNSIVLYKGCTAYIPVTGSSSTDIAAVAKYNTNGTILFSGYNNNNLRSEFINVELYSFI